MTKLHTIIKLLAGLVVVLSFMGCASTRTHEGTGEYIDDAVITTRVKSAIFSDPVLKILQINVETFKGTVQLSGFVNSAASVTKAREIAKAVKGVVSVQTNLIVK
jgi:osmotically-inducible protein OsmY